MQAQVVAYNVVIAQQAQAAGATLVDINALFANITANGPIVNCIRGTSAFLGGSFSLDGVHPTNTGYAVIANAFIDTMNKAFQKRIPDVELSAMAKTDPLWPPNIKVQGMSSHAMLIPSMLGRRSTRSWRRTAARSKAGGRWDSSEDLRRPSLRHGTWVDVAGV